jgi:hypothetical protein
MTANDICGRVHDPSHSKERCRNDAQVLLLDFNSRVIRRHATQKHDATLRDHKPDTESAKEAKTGADGKVLTSSDKDDDERQDKAGSEDKIADIPPNRDADGADGFDQGNKVGEDSDKDSRIPAHDINIFQHTVSDEWRTKIPGYSEEICSRLPFRAFVRRQFQNYDWAPFLGAGHRQLIL